MHFSFAVFAECIQSLVLSAVCEMKQMLCGLQEASTASLVRPRGLMHLLMSLSFSKWLICITQM